jgi:hypothetical protein
VKNTIKLLIVLVMALAAFSQHSTALAGGNFRFRGDTADAYFSSFDGCVYTEMYVFASDGINQSPPGPAGVSSGTDLWIYQYDSCNDIQLRDAYGFAWLAGPDFQVSGKLGSAALNATVNVYDYVTDSFFDVYVNLTWTGVGATFRQSSNSHYDSPGCKVHNRFRGTFRSAAVSGTVSDGVTNFAQGSSGGSIASVKSGDLFIGCN